MTDVTNTSATSEESKTAAAAAIFALILGAVAGGAGILIAAMAVGAERAWNGRAGRSRTRSGRRSWQDRAAAHRVWLDEDREARRQQREDRRNWRAKGADPDVEPVKPVFAARLGRSVRRNSARIVLALDRSVHGVGRFVRGFREGFSAARTVRKDGGKFGDVVRARPADIAQPEPAADAVAADAAAPVQTPEANKTVAGNDLPDVPAAQPPEPAAVTPSEHRAAWYLLQAELLRAASANKTGQAEQVTPAAPDTQASTEHGTTQTSDAATAPADTTSGTQPHVNNEGAQMSAPQGETNLDLTAADLDNIQRQISEIIETVDQLAQQKSNLRSLVAAAGERVDANGGTSATAQALDSALSVVTSIGAAVGGISDATTETADHINAAHEGLNPARDAQDALHSSGARGEFIATATSD